MERESKELSNEKFKPPYTANKIFPPKLLWNNSRLRLRSEESCLKQIDATPFPPKNLVNLFIAYELDRWSRDLNTDFTLKRCLFVAVKLTKNADPDKHKYRRYGIGFDLRSEFLLSDGSMWKNGIF